MKIEFNNGNENFNVVKESNVLESLELGCMAELIGFLCGYLATYIKKEFDKKSDQVKYLMEVYTTTLYMLADDWDGYDIIREDTDEL